MANPKVGISLEDLSGRQKAAVLMMSLGTDTAARIMAHLPAAEVEVLSGEIARLEEIPKSTVEQVLRELEQQQQAMGDYLQRGREFAGEVLERALGRDRAGEVIERVQSSLDPTGFEILKEIDTEQLVSFIQREHPQTVALILAHMKPRQAASILTELEGERQIDVLSRMATMEKVSPEMVQEVKESLSQMFSNWKRMRAGFAGGLEVVADILSVLDRASERRILSALEGADPALAAKVRAELFRFEDILKLSDGDLRQLLKEIDSATLALALKAASEELRTRIFSNVSQRAAEMLRDEMEYLGPVRLKSVEDAQTQVTDAVLRLDQAGQITLARSHEEEQLIV